MKKNKILSVFAAAALMVSAMPFASISANAADDDITGNTMLTAEELTLNKVVSSEASGGTDHDWYVFTLTEPSKVNVICQNSGTNAFYFKIYDEKNDNSTVYTTSSAVYSVNTTLYLTAGNYYIYLNSSYNSFTYDMKVTSTPSNLSFDASAENNTMTEAIPVDFDTDYNAQISQNDNIDYYTFELPKEARVTFNFTGALDNIDWNLYDNEDDLIKHGIYQKDSENDTKVSKRKSLILKEGKYTLSLESNKNSPSYGQYSFSLNALENYGETAVNGIISFGDINKDGKVDSSDASVILSYYAYRSTNTTNPETDMNKWVADKLGISEEF
ncbi:MAG: hypothetical protein IJM19_05955 [Ruminococcus sp.]|nr:hypothetical protein [Ruminococcus sp.]